MNSELYGKTYPVPQDVLEYLDQCSKAVGEVDETTEGFKRNKDLREKGEITYQQLKRMKNWFDNFNGHQDEIPHILNGGHYVKNWVENTLKGDRDTIWTVKVAKPSAEAREAFVKVAGQRCEKTRTEIRGYRKDGMDKVRICYSLDYN